jgi:hypothetical protein
LAGERQAEEYDDQIFAGFLPVAKPVFLRRSAHNQACLRIGSAAQSGVIPSHIFGRTAIHAKIKKT